MNLASPSFINPLIESNKPSKTADSCVMVIFGATGDLTARKLLPAIYNLAKEGLLPAHFACVGFARRKKSHEEFRKEVKQAIDEFSRSKPIDQELWQRFSQQIFYHQSEFDHDEGYESLGQLLQKLDQQFGTKGNRVFYLSIQPSYFPLVAEKLSLHQLIEKPEPGQEKWSRVIIEKPFGRDLESAEKLQAKLLKFLDESQIYRIDHYLGKESVQNLLVFRFSNPIFEAIWNHQFIDNVQITVSEEIGIGSRGNFWEEAGLLRDIMQNHVMQLLTLVAMEPPISLKATSIRDEKVKVLDCIRPIAENLLESQVVRGQYSAGYIQGNPVKSYREEDNVDPHSNIETFAAMKLFIDNWRWANVPFYIRAGKRLPKRATKIVITFKKAPGYLFQEASQLSSNVLVIRIQPDEGISLKINCKVPALNTAIQPVKMDFHYGSYFGSTPPEAYERLLCDCMAGDNTLFARDDEVLASWKVFTPILHYWNAHPRRKCLPYTSGSWGPEAANELLTKDGRSWRLV